MSRRAVVFAALGAVFVIGTFARAVEKSGDDRRRYEYTSKDGGFKIIFPGKPTEKTEKFFGDKLNVQYIVTNTGMYFAAWADIPKFKPAANEEELYERLQRAMDFMLNAIGAEAKETKRLKFEKKYPGLETMSEMNTGIGMNRLRIYIVDKRFHMMWTIGVKSFVEGDEAAAFIASFWLTKN